ncbi:cubilin-like [Penaeus japonicus]|uniref:cubilin-like n=1 Tax=Penaeus japonicus TaxID=27405 RepID=UPI001C711FE4|nr:cubilin-like [Penaeus japonicus]
MVEGDCTSTTSTTTSSTTTTSTTTTNPSTPSWAPCELSTDGAFINLASPNFPLVYPNDAMCMLSNLTDELGLFLIDIKMLRLGPGEVLQIENPYTKPRMLMGYMPRKTIVIPSAQFRATFTSDSERRWRGFRLVARVDSNTGCHQKLSATNGGVITSPGFPSRHPWRTYCEWHITASEGKKVRLVFTLMKIRFFNYLAVNPTSDPYYSPGSVIYLRGRRLPAPVESNSNLIRIFFAGRFPTKGFRLEYSEV